MRPKFIIELYKNLKQIQREDTPNEILQVIINDIRKFLRMDEDNYKQTNTILEWNTYSEDTELKIGWKKISVQINILITIEL